MDDSVVDAVVVMFVSCTSLTGVGWMGKAVLLLEWWFRRDGIKFGVLGLSPLLVVDGG